MAGRFSNMGEALYRIGNKLTENQNLCKLVYYTGKNPLSQPAIVDTTSLLEKNFFLTPKLPESSIERGATINVIFDTFSTNPNSSFKLISLTFLILSSPEQWLIQGQCPLRVFQIMQEIDQLFNEKKIAGIGNLKFASADFVSPSPDYSGYSVTYVYDDFNK